MEMSLEFFEKARMVMLFAEELGLKVKDDLQDDQLSFIFVFDEQEQ